MLLAPADAYADEDAGSNSSIERGESDDASETDPLLHSNFGSQSDFASGSITPENDRYYAHSHPSDGSDSEYDAALNRDLLLPLPDDITAANGHAIIKASINGHFPNGFKVKKDTVPKGPKGWPIRVKRAVNDCTRAVSSSIAAFFRRIFSALPQWLQKGLTKVSSWIWRFLLGCWEFMNPPLWAMLAAIIVASIPPLQHLFFDKGTFLSNSATRAISQSGGVAVPLILVVLGANLARNTLPKEDQHSIEDSKIERNLVIASLISRMLIPTIIMAPFLAIFAKYVPVSILDDPIFVIVCFLLTGAPSALQLAQICQINNVYMGAMSRLLFQSYVIWILPSTLVLVMLALETVEWAA